MSRKGRPAGHRPPRLSLILDPGRGRGSGHLCAISGGLHGGIRAQNLVDTRCTRRGEVRGGACRGRFRSRSGHGLQMARAARPHARRRRAAGHADCSTSTRCWCAPCSKLVRFGWGSTSVELSRHRRMLRAAACRRETDDSAACNPDSRAGAQAAVVVDFTVCAPLVLQVWMTSRAGASYPSPRGACHCI